MKGPSRERVWLSLYDAARRLRVTRLTMLTLIQQGEVPARLVGNRWWVSEDKLRKQSARSLLAGQAFRAKRTPAQLATSGGTDDFSGTGATLGRSP